MKKKSLIKTLASSRIRQQKFQNVICVYIRTYSIKTSLRVTNNARDDDASPLRVNVVNLAPNFAALYLVLEYLNQLDIYLVDTKPKENPAAKKEPEPSKEPEPEPELSNRRNRPNLTPILGSTV
jgi:hypothetical protein